VRRFPTPAQLHRDVLDLATGLITSAPGACIDVVGAVRVVDSLTPGSVIVGGGGIYLLVGPGLRGGAGSFPFRRRGHAAPDDALRKMAATLASCSSLGLGQFVTTRAACSASIS
jgi:hypothetical protein